MSAPHNQSPLPSPTVPQSGGMMLNRHLRVQHPGYSPHTTPHHSPSVVYTPTTTQQNVFQFHEGMHHNMEEMPMQSPGIQSPNVPLHSPNVPMQSPVPLQSPNVPQSPGHRYIQQQRFNFPPNVESLQIKTETPSSPFFDTNQASPQQVPLRYQNQNTEAMLNAISSYTETEMLRGLENNSDTLTQRQPDFDLFDADNSVPDPYLETTIQQDVFPESTASFITTSDFRTTVTSTVSTVASKPTGLKTRGRGRGGRQPGHRPNLVCQICGKRFNNSSAIAKHKLTHSDERKYACTICSKAFKRQDHLNGHMLTHRDKKPYECKFDNCDKSYSDARSLRRHLENHHSMVDSQYSQRMYSQNYQSGQNSQSSQYFQFDQRQFPDNENWRQFRSGDSSPGYAQQVSPISPAAGAPSSPQQRSAWSLFDDGPKTVECTLCHRRFKNVPALNGHMRLHGGYFKKEDKPEEKEEKKEEGQMLPPVQASFSQKQPQPQQSKPQPTQQSFQKPAPVEPKFPSQQDLAKRSYDEDVRRLQKLALMDGVDISSGRVDPINFIGQNQVIHSVLNQEMEARPVTAAITLAGMSRVQEQDHPTSILERRLLGYSEYPRFDREEEHQLSIKSPTTGTLFSFPERPPSQTQPQSEERKRHLSADADKFTSPKRLNEFEFEEKQYRTMEEPSNPVFNRPKDPVPEMRRSDPLSRSCPSGALFRNPGEPVNGRRRKQRPEPLFIPPYVNHFGYQSRLRSPRLWDKDVGITPPPYTPPPMLSPARKGCGLFWTIQPYPPVTPKSAPITPKLAPVRLSSTGDETDVQSEVEEEPPPATDIKPHVNVGSQYQAEIPDCCGFSTTPDKEDLVWCPDSVGDNSLDEIQCYMDFACCAAVPGSGTNKEYAVHLLHYSNGDIQKALTLLMLDQPQFPKNHVLSSYKYDETDHWSTDDIDSFHNALLKCDKDFYSIGRECFKSTKQCIEFYYLWKKVCPDEYKRLRTLRRKREAEELYNLRSKTEDPSDSTLTCGVLECTATFNTREALIEHERVHTQNSPSPVSMEGVPSPGDQSLEEFPCKVCGKVFYKVKSRNAHMKRHRPEQGKQ